MKKTISIVTVMALIVTIFSALMAMAAESPVTVLFRNAIVNDLTNQLDLRYKITANENIDLSKLTIRYYYTNNNTQPQNYYLDEVDEALREHITGAFAVIVPPADKADSCFDLGFSSGGLSQDATTEICLRLVRNDWSAYDQTQNYSFKADDDGEFTLWNNITVYYDGKLIQGTEPADAGTIITPEPQETPDVTEDPNATPTPAPTDTPEATPTGTPEPTPEIDGPVWVQTAGGHKNTSNTMYIWYKIISRSEEAIDLSRLQIKYYYTNDNHQEQIMECDNFQDETVVNREIEDVVATFYPLTETTDNRDYCYEVSFTEHAGQLNPEGFIRIDTRVHSEDWSDYSYTNDYSFQSSAEFKYWDKIEVYIDGKLVWGENLNADSNADDEKYIPVRTMGFEYEQTYDIDSNIEKPEILSADVEILDREKGLYRITIQDNQFTCDESATPFFFWSAREGVFSEPSDNFNSVVFQADEGTGHRQVKVIVGIGDGLGYVDKKAILLDGNKTGGETNE